MLALVAVVQTVNGSAPVPMSPAAAYLAGHPGGELLNEFEVSYGGGAFVVTAPNPNLMPSCPQNWFCFWDKADFLGYRGKLQDCYGQSLANFKWSKRVVSAYYNINDGAVQFLDGSYPLFQIGVGNRSLSNAGANSRRATYVYRYC